LARAGDQPVQAAPVPVPDAGGGGGGNNRVAEMAAEVERLRQQEAELRQEQERMREQLSQIAGARPAAPAPQINAWIGELRPTQDVVRGSGSTGEELPAGRPASLILMARHPETHRGHRVEIVDSGGKTVWSAEGLVSNPETKDYGLTLPADTLKPGEYTIRVSALEDGKRVELESYTVRVK
ncbi:MAG TPA: hypothetical protein VFR31_12150, partial [Thermoanaerobaculia bacterium]|nr:hypothetical protein [Thermoanaerobaculia bacterium]